MQYFDKTNIDFISKRQLFFYMSTILTIFGIVSAIIVGIDYGIDFVGGTEIAVKFDKVVDTEHIRNAVEKGGFAGSEIKSFGEDNQFLIRVKESENAPEKVNKALTEAFPGNNIETLKVDRIGPKVGSELRTMAFLAVILSMIAMLIYIAFRFEFVFGFGAIIALIHDVVITFTLTVFIHKFTPLSLEVNQTFLAAMLTVIGYSINDTVIIFDRIRENREVHKGMGFVKLVNMSINETLSRTINTVATVVLVLLTMVFFGGPVLQGFAFIMLLGIVFGTYSSVYVASSFVIWYLEKVKKMDEESGGLTKKKGLSPAKA